MESLAELQRISKKLTAIPKLAKNDKYLRLMNQVIHNEAIKRKFAKPDEYPFHEYRIPAARKAKRTLRKPDILKIWNYEVVPQSKEGKAKNYFFVVFMNNLSYHTG